MASIDRIIADHMASIRGGQSRSGAAIRSLCAVAILPLIACPSPRLAPVVATPGETAPSSSPPPVAPRAGGYYKDDGPGEHPPANLDALPDAVAKLEPLNRFANRPYS